MKTKQMTANELVAFRQKEQDERAKVICQKLGVYQGLFALRTTAELRKDVERICNLHPKVKDELMMLIPMIQNRTAVNVIVAQINEPSKPVVHLQESDFTEYAKKLGVWESLLEKAVDNRADEVEVTVVS